MTQEDRNAIASRQLTKLIGTGVTQQEAVIRGLMDEVERRQDYLVPATSMQFNPQTDGRTGDVHLMFGESGDVHRMPLTELAWSQVSGKLEIPNQFLTTLVEERPITAAALLNDLRGRMKHRSMIRTVDNNVRALLAENYKPIDQGMIVRLGFTASARREPSPSAAVSPNGVSR